MKNFEKFIIIDWYDNIIKTFVTIDKKKYYCSMIYNDFAKDEYIYVCISLDCFVGYDKIISILESDTIKESWEQFYLLLNSLHKKNESYLIKTKDLQFGTREIVKYENNFSWKNKVLFSDYPENLSIAKKIDKWDKYFS